MRRWFRYSGDKHEGNIRKTFRVAAGTQYGLQNETHPEIHENELLFAFSLTTSVKIK